MPLENPSTKLQHIIDICHLYGTFVNPKRFTPRSAAVALPCPPNAAQFAT